MATDSHTLNEGIWYRNCLIGQAREIIRLEAEAQSLRTKGGSKNDALARVLRSAAGRQRRALNRNRHWLLRYFMTRRVSDIAQRPIMQDRGEEARG